MEYRIGIAVGLIATILYFDLSKEYYHQMMDYFDVVSFWKDPETVLADRYDRLFSKVQPHKHKVFIGFNGNIDVILNGPELLSVLQGTDSKEGKAIDVPVITSVSDLESVFSYYFAKETAAERFINEEKTWETIKQGIEKIKNKKYYIGGNAALIARTMSSFNSEITLAVPGGVRLQRQLAPFGVQVVETCRHEDDELHVIMEYAIGDKYHGHVSKRANRFIFSRDINNSNMSAISCVSEADLAGIDLVVIAGFHMLESQPATYQKEVIKTVIQLVQDHPLVHLELASMTDSNFLSLLFHELTLRVDSLGLNEAELEFLNTIIGGEAVDVKNAVSVKRALVNILKKSGSSDRLSRIHFHCLTFHVIVEKQGLWEGGDISVASGTYIAARYACDTPSYIVPSNHELRYHGNNLKPHVKESIGGYNVYTSPVLVCRTPLKTVGLGDSISATGLLYTTKRRLTN